MIEATPEELAMFLTPAELARMEWEGGQPDREAARTWREKHPYPPGICECCGHGIAITKGTLSELAICKSCVEANRVADEVLLDEHGEVVDWFDETGFAS
jgi:hypothetical protein